MRKLLLLLVTGLLISGCNDIVPGDNGDPNDVPENLVYLTVNIIPPSGSNTKSPGIEAGEETENEIKSVRLYFFDSAGNSINVIKGTSAGSVQSYFDFGPESENVSTGTYNDGGVLTPFISVTLSLGESGGNVKTPSRVVSLINPTPNIKNLNITSIDGLRDICNDFESLDNGFLMSNSVYVNNGSIVDATEITNDNFASSIEMAGQHPIVIHVERVLARIDIDFNKDNYKVMSTESEGDLSVDIDEENSKPLYVKILGWQVTSSPVMSGLLKSVNPNWETYLFKDSGYPWNNPSGFRSFWALNPKQMSENTPEENYHWYSFNDIMGTGNPIPGRYYIQENGSSYENGKDLTIFSAPSYPSKIIMATQLVDKDGNGVEFAEYLGKYYSLENLKTAVLSKNLNLWTPDGQTGFRQVEEGDIDMETRSSWTGTSGTDVIGGYYVYFILSEEAKALKWYLKEDDKYIEIPDVKEEINKQVGLAKVWKEGYSYYFADIDHADKQDVTVYPGVVRNFIYRITVKGFKGLGTPVYDPDEVIYPENPTDDGWIISADISVVPWRLIEEDFEVKW